MKIIFSLALAMISMPLMPGLAAAQYSYVHECAESVANQLNISTLDVNTQLGPFTPNETRIVLWRSLRGGDRNGFCEFNTDTGELVRSEAGDYTGPVDESRGYTQRSMAYGGPAPETAVKAPRVKVDTSGKGDYNGPNGSFRITRGWVDTKAPQTTVALSGEHHFKINFYGYITQQNGSREFTMQINGSDQGDATGTATFRLNDDRNEVEYISMIGRLNGRDFNGNFRR
jgi:hypothetical protein